MSQYITGRGAASTVSCRVRPVHLKNGANTTNRLKISIIGGFPPCAITIGSIKKEDHDDF